MVSERKIKRVIPLLLVDGVTTDPRVKAAYYRKQRGLIRIEPVTRQAYIDRIAVALKGLDMEIERSRRRLEVM